MSLSDWFLGKYGKESQVYNLPPPQPTDRQMYSVPRMSGGYDYYQAPPGTQPGWNDNYPLPNVKHRNKVGLASIAVGRDMPHGSVWVGSGERAIGSITPMPGAGGQIPGLGAPTDGIGGLGGVSLEQPASTAGGWALPLAFVLAMAAGVMLIGRE